MITIRDVAKQAGCSISTVSYALNGDNRIRTETRDRILKIASDMGYYPMNAARTLKSKKTFTIGVFAIGYLSPVFNELLDSISIHLSKDGYNAITTMNVNTIAKMITERSVDGLIIVDAIISSDLIEYTKKINLPICFLNQFVGGDNVLTCVQDNKLSLYNMTELMFSKGCSSIAYLSGRANSFDNQQRSLGYIQACEEHNINQIIIDGDFTISSGYLAGKKIVSEGKMFDAIVCANDEMCVGILEAFREHNIFAPRDVLVSGYDDIELSRYYSPHITTVSINRYEWGMIIANRMFNMLNGINIEKNTTIKGRIIERESTNYFIKN